MKSITIPSIDTTLFTFNKGGSTLLHSALRSFLDWKGIEIHSQIKWGTNKILIVRNPIQRFYSGYSQWIDKSGISIDKMDNKGIIEGLSYFFKGIRNREGEFQNDYHYLPQCVILKEMGLPSDIKIIQLEKLSEDIERRLLWDNPTTDPQLWDMKPRISNHFPFFLELGIYLDEWDGMVFGGMWLLSKANLNGHHRGLNSHLQSLVSNNDVKLGREIENYFQSEIIKYGYESII